MTGPARLSSALAAVAMSACAATSPPSRGPASAAPPSGTTAGYVSIERVREPDLAPMLAFVAASEGPVDCEIYQVTEAIAKVALGDVVKRHHRVRLILEPIANSDTSWVAGEGIQLVTTPRGVRLDHAKACVRDYGTAHEAVLVATANWSHAAETQNLDYAAVLAGTNPGAASIAETIEADMAGEPPLAPAAGAIVSPQDSREAISALLTAPGVTSVVLVEEEMTDGGMSRLLADLASRSVRVTLVAPQDQVVPAGCTQLPRLFVPARQGDRDVPGQHADRDVPRFAELLESLARAEPRDRDLRAGPGAGNGPRTAARSAGGMRPEGVTGVRPHRPLRVRRELRRLRLDGTTRLDRRDR